MAGDVSKNKDFYQVIQYDDILNDTADAIRRKQQTDDLNFGVSGYVELADDYHKMTANTIFDGDETTLHLEDDDAIQTGLNIRSGHSGFHGLKIQPSALRQICSNGMMGWVADKTFEQTHSEEYQPALIHHGVDAVIDGAEELEQRLEAAQNEYLLGGKDELRLLMHEMIGDYLDTPIGDIPLSIEAETQADDISLYDAYQSMTRALSHHAKDDVPQYRLDRGFDEAARLLDTGYNQLPDAEQFGEQVIERRANQVIENQDIERYWDQEDETLQELMAQHGLTA
ncbi:hypothetical protein ACFO0N_15055 [Halobium salinum]|uniref:DUF932 domain-containing protein n=1 Tax=Halobium salinum TaxID=1364940 RepID=A0ABD5PES0_9EURY|nr:hypothetical protein [Halobium salinum]